MRNIIIILLTLCIGTTAIAQRTEVRLKRLEQGSKVGALIIAGPDSFAIWSDSLVFVNELLTTPADTFASRAWVRANTIVGEQLSQDLYILNDTLYIPGDTTPVDLSPYLDNTDAQNLSLSPDSLLIDNASGVAAADVITQWNLLDTSYLDSLAYWNKNAAGLFTNDKVGFGVTNPIQAIDVDGQVRIRGLQVDNTVNNIVGADLDNVLRKRALTDLFDGVTIIGDGVINKFSVDTSLLGSGGGGGGGVTQISGGLGIIPDGPSNGAVTLSFDPTEFGTSTTLDGNEEMFGYSSTIGQPVKYDIQGVFSNVLNDQTNGIDFSESGSNRINVDLDLGELSLGTSFNGAFLILGNYGNSTERTTYFQDVLKNTLTSTDGSISFTDNGTTLNLAASGGGGSPLTQEEVQDYVGLMVSGNTELGISVTYDDSNNEFDFVAADISASNEIQGFDIAQLTGTNLELSLTQNSTTHTIDLSSIGGGSGVSSITGGTGIVPDASSTGAVTLSVDLNQLSNTSSDMSASDEFVVIDNTSSVRKEPEYVTPILHNVFTQLENFAVGTTYSIGSFDQGANHIICNVSSTLSGSLTINFPTPSSSLSGRIITINKFGDAFDNNLDLSVTNGFWWNGSTLSTFNADDGGTRRFICSMNPGNLNWYWSRM